MSFLSESHRRKLADCGLSAETVARAMLHTGSSEEVREVLGYGTGGTGLVIPYDREGRYSRVRIDNPGPDGKRYRSPKDGSNRVYFPPGLPAEYVLDGTKLLWVTEGEFKALKATQEGLPCVALSGVWSWKQRQHGQSLPVGDLDRIAWRGRVVVVVFDSDLADKPAVAWAEHALCAELRRREAQVYVLRLEEGAGGAKVGLDDFLVKFGSAAFRRLKMQSLSEADKGDRVFLRPSDLLDAYWARASAPGHRVKTGYSDLDRDLRGIVAGEVMTILGRTTSGKTTFGLNLVKRMTADDRLPVLFFTLEQPAEQLFERMASIATGVPGVEIEQRAAIEDPEMLTRLVDAVAEWNHVVMVEKPCTITQVDELIEKANGAGLWTSPLRGVVIDYLGLVTLGQRRSASETEATSFIAKEVKNIAKRHRVWSLLLCQITREGGSGGDPVTMTMARQSVAGDTRVLLADGRYIPIRDLVGTTPEVVALDRSLRPVTAKTSRVWRKGKRDVVRVRTRTGRSITVTPEHPFLTVDGWTDTSDLRVGDRIAASDLRLLAAPSVLWDEVVAVESAGREDVYDATVPGLRNFLAEDLYPSNSGVIEEACDYMLGIWRPELKEARNDAEALAVADHRGEFRCRVLKNRHGPSGRTATLRFEHSNLRVEPRGDS